MRTFVVRIWHAADGESPIGLRGTVRDVRTGEERPFVSGEDLLALLAKTETDQQRDPIA